MSMPPRLLRPVDPPLALYFRPGRNDHAKLLDLLSEGRLSVSGFVMDACLAKRHEELRREARSAGVETVLDPRTVELGTETGFTRSGVADLPWAGPEPHTPEGFERSEAVESLANAIAAFAAEHHFTSVLAPTHVIGGADSAWLEVDAKLTRSLRSALDRIGLSAVPIYYPLCMASTAFHDASDRPAFLQHVRSLPIDALWFRISPFGSTSGPLALKRYIESASAYRVVDLPLVAEHTGSAGIALLAFGAVGGIESGITLGEQFDVRPLLRPPTTGTAFSPPPRVYLHDLGVFLSPKQAAEFFGPLQMRGFFGCKSTNCCRRGWADMLADPRRHFALRRAAEVTRISGAPSTIRTQMYLDRFLRPATDSALRAAKVEPALTKAQKRLEGWRITLGKMVADGYVPPVAAVPSGRRILRRSA